MTLTKHNLKRISAFVSLAKNDLEAARILSAKLPEQAMFHIQQSVEKLVRSLIEAEAGVAGTTHNIRALADLLPTNHPLQMQLRPLHEVSLAATRYRYPTSGGHVFEHEGDVTGLIKEVEAFTESVTAFLKSKKLL